MSKRPIYIPGLRHATLYLTIFLFSLLLCPSVSLSAKSSIKNIRHQSFKGFTRITIELSAPIEFTMNHLSNPDRFYFDLKNTTLPKKVKANFNVGDGILKGVRSRQFSKDTVRVVFDLEKAKDFKASLLNKKNPRLVIDIYASGPAIKEQKPAQEKEPTAQTQKEPSAALKKEPDILQPALKQPEAPSTVKEDASLIASGEKYFESGEYEKALADFRKAAELNPQNVEAFLLIGRTLLKLGRHEEAVEAYKQVLERDPNSADAYDGLGYVYYAQGKPFSAVDAFLTAIKINPDHDDAHAGLGYTYLTIGDVNAAVEQYRVLKTLGSDKADDLFQLIFKENKKQDRMYK